MGEDIAAVFEVCAAFGIGTPCAVTRVTAGYLNRDESVTLPDGRRFFAKGSRHADPRVVAAEHAVIRYAAARGVPAPLPLIAPDGRSVVILGGTPWSVFPFVTGAMLDGPGMEMTLGTRLAATHAALASYRAEGLRFAEGPLVWDTAATLADMAIIEAHIAKRTRAGCADAFDAATPAAFAALRDILVDAPSPEAFGWLPQQVIHGDFYPPNLLCDPSGALVAVLDWEFATVRPRVWDIVRAIAFTFLGVHGAPPDFSAARRCVTAYRSILPLPDEELAAGISLYLWRTAHNLAKYRWHDERGPQPTDVLAAGDLTLVRWLHRYGPALASYLGSSGKPPPELSAAH